MGMAGRLFVAGAGKVLCLDGRTGASIWTWEQAVVAPWYARSVTSFQMKLQLAGEHLYVGMAGCAYCLDAADGRELWRRTDLPLGAGITPEIVVQS